MKNLTITMFVADQSSLNMLLVVFKVLDGLDLENNYTFTPTDIVFSMSAVTYSNAFHLNVPVELYAKFMYRYNQLKRK